MGEKTKILFVFDTLNRGGAETSTLEIARRLRGFTPVVLVLYPGTSLQVLFEEADIKVYSLNINKRWNVLKAYRAMKKIIAQEKPDIIHSNLFMADQLSRWIGAERNIPVVNSFVNDSYAPERYELLNFRGRLSLNFYKAIDRKLSTKCTQFMSLTNAIIENNAKALDINPQSVSVIPRGRDILHMKSNVDNEEVQRIKNTYGTGPIILTVSRLLIRKGYLEAVSAMSKVIKKRPDVHYLIAGEGHDRGKIEKMISAFELEENIILLGNCDNIPSLLEAADIFLFPSHYEGQGGALVEAMLFGKKIIATRIPVLEESVEDNYSARLFTYRDIDDIAKKIIWAIENPEKMEKIAQNAYEVAKVKFDIDKVVKTHEELYNEVILNYKQ